MRNFDIDSDREKKRSFSGSSSSSVSSDSAESIRDFRRGRSLGCVVQLHQVVLDVENTPYVIVKLGAGWPSFIQYYVRSIRAQEDGSFRQMIITNQTPGWHLGGSFSGPKEFLDPDADTGSLPLILKRATAP